MYTFNSRIRYSEVNAEGTLSVESLMDYFQDCSTFQSEDSGVGLEYLSRRHQAWVVNSWQVDISRLPAIGERVITGTVPYEIKGFIGFRNFFMDTEDGERLAVANSVWALVDMEKGLPVRASEDIIKGYPIGQKLEMDYQGRKIAYPKEGTTLDKEPVTVQIHHLDTNMHVNNGQYIRMALGCMNAQDDKIIRLRAEYRNQAHLGDVIKPVINERTEDDRRIYTAALNAENGAAYCMVEITASGV